MRKFQISNFKWCAAICLIAMCSGCQPPNKVDNKATLQAGYTALESQQYEDAIAKADEFLKQTPAGEGSAEAMYLKGRGLEGSVAANPTAAKTNLQNARSAYITALSMQPKQPLESYIRTSLANVAYFQDDYTTALQQWQAAYDALDRDDVKAWALYRIAICQQRLGQFAQADQTFSQVLQKHPNSVPAQRAKEKQGARGFYVQLATFSTGPGADAAIADLRKQGAVPTKANDAQGRAVVRVGPVTTYAQAQALQGRYASKYPDAMIVP